MNKSRLLVSILAIVIALTLIFFGVRLLISFIGVVTEPDVTEVTIPQSSDDAPLVVVESELEGMYDGQDEEDPNVIIATPEPLVSVPILETPEELAQEED